MTADADGVPDVPVAALAVRNLSKTFGTSRVVDDVGFSIAAGECFGLLGPNGAGKTTIMTMICGAQPRTTGTVHVGGVSVDDDREVRRGLGYVPQEAAVYPDLDAVENLRFFGRLKGIRGRALDAQVSAVLDLVGLSGRQRDVVGQYSWGMVRRLNIAVGLLGSPGVLVLDEPTLGVDPTTRRAILEAITELARRGVAVLFSSHQLDEVERICHRVAILGRGRVLAEGSLDEVRRIAHGSARVRLTLDDPAALAATCEAVEGVRSAAVSGQLLELLVDDTVATLQRLLAAAEGHSPVRRVEVEEPRLEDVVLQLARHEAADG